MTAQDTWRCSGKCEYSGQNICPGGTPSIRVQQQQLRRFTAIHTEVLASPVDGRIMHIPCRGDGEPDVVRKVASNAARQNKTDVAAIFQSGDVEILVDSRGVSVYQVRSADTAAGAWRTNNYVANAISVEVCDISLLCRLVIPVVWKS